jgi:hypothetical protein
MIEVRGAGLNATATATTAQNPKRFIEFAARFGFPGNVDCSPRDCWVSNRRAASPAGIDN